ncbi:MAG: hypothetical protein H6644_15630 [Caldilineaceae bacterium]|nr:hypothetical protein [Caldilineaceae bacterium]
MIKQTICRGLGPAAVLSIALVRPRPRDDGVVPGQRSRHVAVTAVRTRRAFGVVVEHQRGNDEVFVAKWMGPKPPMLEVGEDPLR